MNNNGNHNPLNRRHRQLVESYQQGNGYRWRACLLASRIVGRYAKGETLALASDLALSVDQVENLARAGYCYRMLRRYRPVSAEGLSWSDIRTRLSPSHFHSLFRLWQRYEFDPHDAANELATAAENGVSVGTLRLAVESIYGNKDAPHWQELFERARPLLSRLVEESSTPDKVRRACKLVIRRSGGD